MPEANYTSGLVRSIQRTAEERQAIEESRTVEFILSTNTRDRHRTILNQDNWMLDNYRANPIVGYAHHYGGLCESPNPDNVIGTSSVRLEDGNLIGSVTFERAEDNPLAEKIFRKVLNGTLRTASVGFIPHGKGHYGEGDEAEGRENETYYFERQELLEWSIVDMPSNPDAVAKSRSTQVANAYVFIKRELGLSFAEIESMTVGDVFNRLNGVTPKKKEESTNQPNSKSRKLKKNLI